MSNIDKFMESISLSSRYRWCENKACGCRGCVNRSEGIQSAGFSKAEWQAWVDRNPEPYDKNKGKVQILIADEQGKGVIMSEDITISEEELILLDSMVQSYKDFISNPDDKRGLVLEKLIASHKHKQEGWISELEVMANKDMDCKCDVNGSDCFPECIAASLLNEIGEIKNKCYGSGILQPPKPSDKS